MNSTTSRSYSRLADDIKDRMRHVAFKLSIQNMRIKELAKINACLKGKRSQDSNNLAQPWQCGNGAVYIITDKTNQILYVGSSTKYPNKTPFDTISGGLRRKYHYDFPSKHLVAKVHLFTFGRIPGKNRNKLMKYIEGIEAETVYGIRSENGRWPSRQHEIHFRPELTRNRWVISGAKFVIDQMTKTKQTHLTTR